MDAGDIQHYDTLIYKGIPYNCFTNILEYEDYRVPDPLEATLQKEVTRLSIILKLTNILLLTLY